MTDKKILVVDDERAACELLAQQLRQRGFIPVTCSDARSALEHLETDDFSAALVDAFLPAMNGLELCRQIRENRPLLPVLVMTGFGSMETAVTAMRAGAFDFINKPFDIELVVHSLRRAIARFEPEVEIKRLRQEVVEEDKFDGILGRTRPMRMVFDMIKRVADTDATVLVTGESGTGKELIARALHDRSRRAQRPFVAINCGAITETLLESELFGHSRGAFTDAKTDRGGLFVAAHGGTLFLDEIGEISLTMQVKLLRVLQERRVRPLGGDHDIPFDVRLITATNRDLESDVEEGRFREELFYRINVVRIQAPPLRVRGSDIVLLAESFVEHFSKQNGFDTRRIHPRAVEKLLAYSWPGNVRELQNCIERAVALSSSYQIGVEDLPLKLRDYVPPEVLHESEHELEMIRMEEVERRYIFHVLRALGNNKTQAAAVLGLDRKTLYRKLARYRSESMRLSAMSHGVANAV